MNFKLSLFVSGKTSEGGMYPTNLSAAMVPIRDQDDCSNRLKETRLGEYFELNERFICAGGEGEIIIQTIFCQKLK